MVGFCEIGIFDAGDVSPEVLDERARGGFGAVGVIGGVEAIEDEHGGDHVLDTVVSVGEVVHWFVLFVDNADAGFVGAASDGFDVVCGFSML